MSGLWLRLFHFFAISGWTAYSANAAPQNSCDSSSLRFSGVLISPVARKCSKFSWWAAKISFLSSSVANAVSILECSLRIYSSVILFLQSAVKKFEENSIRKRFNGLLTISLIWRTLASCWYFSLSPIISSAFSRCPFKIFFKPFSIAPPIFFLNFMLF